MSHLDPFHANFQGLQDLITSITGIRMPIAGHVQVVDIQIDCVVGSSWVHHGSDGFRDNWWRGKAKPAIENYADLYGDLANIIEQLLAEERGARDDVLSACAVARTAGVLIGDDLELQAEPVEESQQIALIQCQAAIRNAWN